MGEDEILKEIDGLVAEFCRMKHGRKKFEPGKTYIQYAGRVFDERELKLLVRSSLDFWLTAGPYTKIFEHKLARFFGLRHAMMVNSGSSANLVALSALTSPRLGERRLRRGDEVITSASGFPTTVNPILQNGAVPVFVDVELATYNPSATAIEEAIGERTRAIMVAHTLGNPFELDRIAAIAKKHGLWLVEDCCDALGSRFGGKHVGTFGDIATLSLYPAHHITTGEGGAVLTGNDELKTLAESFRDWGRDCWCPPGVSNTCGKRFGWQLGSLPPGYDHKYIYSHIGYNLKATDLQAAIGAAQMDKLPSFVDARRRNFMKLYGALRQYEDVLVLPKWHEKSEPSWFGFPITVREGAPFTRNGIVQFLENARIATRMLFGGNMIRQPAYDGVGFRVSGKLENSDRVMNDMFWVGVYPGITDEMMDYMIARFEEFLRTRR
ncbi:MAG: lipopolysaccharide biosynthesis protein RfbH [Candidatus Micrarchaeota archaeon]